MTPNYTEITIANDSNLSNQAKDKDLQVITGSENPETERNETGTMTNGLNLSNFV